MLFIPIQQLKSGMKLSEDVLVFENSNARLLTKGTILTERFVEGLRRFRIPGVYLRDEITGDIMPSKPILTARSKNKTLKNIEWIFQHTEQESKSRTVNYLKHIDKTVLELVSLIQQDKSKRINISDLKEYDEYTFHHSLSVAVISIAIGSKMGMAEDELRRLGFSAIMHDIGKMDVPIEIINKTDKLTNEEFEIIKSHPDCSSMYLAHNGVKDEDILLTVRSHHEKYDGSGYPNGLKGEEISLHSRIISVADVYDALTSFRPYRDPMMQHKVTEFIMSKCGTEFDTEVVTAFINKIEFYPVGSFVELSNGKKAVVIGHVNQLRPIVRTIDRPHKTLDLFSDSKTYRIVIQKNFDNVSTA